MFQLESLAGTCLLFWVINPILERNDGFNTLWLSLLMGWAAYIFYALICALEVVGEELACGPERRQAIIAILVIGGFLPVVTRLESWKLLSEYNVLFACMNSGLALLSIGFLLFAYILMWRTPRHEVKPVSDRSE